MAGVAVLPMAGEHSKFWDRFRRLAERCVEEGNIVAGERVWDIYSHAGARLFTIQSANDPGDYLECTLDSEAAVLTCRPGPAINCGCLQFRLLGSSGDRLRLEDTEYTLDQAITLMLDELAWMEDCGDADEQRLGAEAE